MSISATASSRLFGRLRDAAGPLEQIGAAIIGFVMSGASIMLTASPFGVAWAGAAPPEQAIAATVGAVLGYLFLLKGNGTLRYMACLLLLLALRWAFSFISKARMPVFSPLLASCTIATTGLAIAISGDRSLYGFIMVFCETAITATAGILFGKSYRTLREGTGLTRTNGVCTGIWLAVLYMGLSAFTVGGVCPPASVRWPLSYAAGALRARASARPPLLRRVLPRRLRVSRSYWRCSARADWPRASLRRWAA